MITGRFAALLAIAIPLPALLPSPWLVVAVVAVVLAAVAALDLAAAGALTGIRLERRGDTAVWLGESASVELTVRNEGDRTARLRLRDSWVPSAGAGAASHRLRLSAGGSGADSDGGSSSGSGVGNSKVGGSGSGSGSEETITTRLTPTRHGDRPAVRVTLRSYGPLGLAYRQRRQRWNETVTPKWTLRVLPRFPSRRILPEKLAKLRIFDGAVVTRGRGQGTEFDALREYVIGDDVRSIDWRASARTHDVMVRTWRPERDRRVICVLDTGRTAAARLGDEPRLDASIDAALLLSVLASRADDRVDLIALDSEIRARVEGLGHRSKLPRIINAMAALEPALVETDFSRLAGDLLRRGHKRALVVIFTAMDAAPLVEGLLSLLPRLTTRHRVVVASVRDPEIARLAVLPASGATATDVHLAAAAELALGERDRVRAVLSQQGAIVIDETREMFASKVADAYLMLKANGRL